MHRAHRAVVKTAASVALAASAVLLYSCIREGFDAADLRRVLVGIVSVAASIGFGVPLGASAITAAIRKDLDQRKTELLDEVTAAIQAVREDSIRKGTIYARLAPEQRGGHDDGPGAQVLRLGGAGR